MYRLDMAIAAEHLITFLARQRSRIVRNVVSGQSPSGERPTMVDSNMEDIASANQQDTKANFYPA